MNLNLDKTLKDKSIDKWIKEGMDEDAITFTEKLGFHLCDKKTEEDRAAGYAAMTTSQIRNIFGEAKRIQAKASQPDANASELDPSDKLNKKIISDLLLLRPKMAYAEARVVMKSKESRIKDFRKVMNEANKAVGDSEENLQRFIDFFEAILAYHKFYGGRD